MTDTPQDLLTAVDNLTRPDVLTRYAGTDHDHDWLELVRPTSGRERATAKAHKPPMKLPKTMKTGEWWCPWCDLVVTERPADVAQETINRRDDPPLLDQLAARISTVLGDGGTHGANTGGSPIDLAAFMLHGRIVKDIRDWMTALGARPGKDLTAAQLLRSWYTLRLAGVTPVGSDDIYRLKLEGWRTEIMDILDPPTQIPYLGQACPLCGQTAVSRHVDGDLEGGVALWAFLRPTYRVEGSYGMCKACNEVLARDADPLMLRRKMNGTISSGKVSLYTTRTDQTGAES